MGGARYESGLLVSVRLGLRRTAEGTAEVPLGDPPRRRSSWNSKSARYCKEEMVGESMGNHRGWL
jgi:hypothetical protein